MKKTARGFTLVELLVVIAIIAILAAVVVLIVNPVEMTRRSRDAARMTDLANLQQAINIAAQENSTIENFLCAGVAPPCSGRSDTGGRSNDGTGWVKVNLATQSVKVPTLPVDPKNVDEAPADDGKFYYTYNSDGVDWEINAILESVQYGGDETTGKDADDGGDNTTKYEVGSKLTLAT